LFNSFFLEISLPTRTSAKRHDFEPFNRLIDLLVPKIAWVFVDVFGQLIERQIEDNLRLENSPENLVAADAEVESKIIFILRT